MKYYTSDSGIFVWQEYYIRRQFIAKMKWFSIQARKYHLLFKPRKMPAGNHVHRQTNKRALQWIRSNIDLLAYNRQCECRD